MTNRILTRGQSFTEAAKLIKDGFDLNKSKTSVQNMYGDVSALLDRLDAKDGAARGEALTLYYRMRNAI